MKKFLENCEKLVFGMDYRALAMMAVVNNRF